MDFRLVDKGWDREVEQAVSEDPSNASIVSPFIKKSAAIRLLSKQTSGNLKVITRFNLSDFASGVSDLSALRLLLDHGAEIRGLRNLHAKLYIFGSKRAILTSANLTEAALLRNHEFGFVSGDAGIVSECIEYFDRLWLKSCATLTRLKLEEWESIVSAHLARGGQYDALGNLPDFGADANLPPEVPGSSPWTQEASQGFVKFFGESRNRAPSTLSVLEEVKRSGSHWACTYPRGKRPRNVSDGAVMFMGRMTKDPNDIVIYGRAIGMRHKPDSDDASLADLALRPWKSAWPHYIRVHHAEFVAGTLANGFSLRMLMDEFGANSFASTQRNALKGSGNVEPRHAYNQQPAVELTLEAMAWLNKKLDSIFWEHGKLSPANLGLLDWPDD
ncbi:phospholipase D family protein [Paraburkholderia fungorum]|uniref:phospholipase D family protein n=1 Tax=Paraburkholderia fungorum TaxID=134537 RepID=UPI001C1E9755|nr:phospholipase D family protein [Paraburkholderia fungorum]MBU7438593.1 phospholipase D family protein [Paraburkholderia fungorum]